MYKSQETILKSSRTRKKKRIKNSNDNNNEI